MRKAVSIIAGLSACLAAHGQRQVIFYDPELGTPAKDVLVWVDRNSAEATNPLGEIVIPERFDTLHANKPGYVSLSIPAEWVTDSIPIIQDYNNIGEVVVNGVYRNNRLAESVKRWTKEARTEFELRNPITGIKFSLADAIDPKLRRIKKQTRKLGKLFNRMDAEGNNPIIEAYRKAIKKSLH